MSHFDKSKVRLRFFLVAKSDTYTNGSSFSRYHCVSPLNNKKKAKLLFLSVNFA